MYEDWGRLSKNAESNGKENRSDMEVTVWGYRGICRVEAYDQIVEIITGTKMEHEMEQSMLCI